MSLRLRINLVLSLVIVAFTLAMAGIIVNDTRTSVREEIESATRVAVQLIETVVRGVYLEAGPAERNQALLAFLRSVGRVRANEIRFYDPAARCSTNRRPRPTGQEARHRSGSRGWSDPRSRHRAWICRAARSWSRPIRPAPSSKRGRS